MNKSLGVLLLTALAAPMHYAQADCDCNTTSHTFFSVRPLYQSASPERVSLFHDRMEREDGHGGAVELTFLGSKSTKNSRLTRYFQPFCKEELTVRAAITTADTVPDKSTDLLSQNFNIITQDGSFESTFKMKPQESVFGIGLTYRQDLGRWFSYCDNEEHPWFLEISSPLVRVNNRVKIEENVINPGGGVATRTDLPAEQSIVGNMTEAFRQTDWLYGKIDESVSMTKWGLADIEFKVGYGWVNTECCGLESYVGLLIPTGNRPKAEYVFEPMIGHNKHWGIMFGSSAHFTLWDNDCYKVYAYLDMMTEYLFKRTERRSLDLKGKPWSRYQAVYANFEQAQQANAAPNPSQTRTALATPGINVFTQDLNVNPGLNHTLNWALALEKDCFDAELGFNLFARQEECISLKNAFPTSIALKAYTGAGETNSFILINNEVSGMNTAFLANGSNYNATLVSEADLDLASASHPSFISYTLYGALGYRFEDYCYPMFIGAGAGYEFGRGNEVLNRWTAWGKFGFSF